MRESLRQDDPKVRLENAAAAFRTVTAEIDKSRRPTFFRFIKILSRFRLHVNIGAQKMTAAHRLKAGWKRMAMAALACDWSHAQDFFAPSHLRPFQVFARLGLGPLTG
jgi:hypothetical protein